MTAVYFVLAITQQQLRLSPYGNSISRTQVKPVMMFGGFSVVLIYIYIYGRAESGLSEYLKCKTGQNGNG